MNTPLPPPENRFTVRLARFVYTPNVRAINPIEIPLGILGEVNLPNFRGVGFLGRLELPEEYLNMMGHFTRREMGIPFDYLMPLIRAAFRDSPQDESVLARLSITNQGSLALLHCHDMFIPTSMLSDSPEEVAGNIMPWLRQEVESEMKSVTKDFEHKLAAHTRTAVKQLNQFTDFTAVMPLAA